ncbi:class I SAM-dependent methyltransferase, partial [Klebsiella pneumoniae]|nr:class I SAM-dependent methyltransferase [Klebsiella pneumoniae]
YPDIKLTIIDSLGKRLTFLDKLVKQLGLDNITLVHSRAEDAGRNIKLRENFDVVTARAVARMSVLSEYCLPLVKVGGYFVALKGPKLS